MNKRLDHHYAHETLNRLNPSSSSRDDAGDTLIEILVAIIILGLTAVALLGAFASDLSGAAIYRNTSTVETVLKNFAEDATYEIQYQISPAPLFSACAQLSGSAYQAVGGTPSSQITYNNHQLLYIPPAGYTVTVVTSLTEYLSASNQFGSICDPTKLEPQSFTVHVTGPRGATGQLTFVVASFNYERYS